MIDQLFPGSQLGPLTQSQGQNCGVMSRSELRFYFFWPGSKAKGVVRGQLISSRVVGNDGVIAAAAFVHHP